MSPQKLQDAFQLIRICLNGLRECAGDAALLILAGREVWRIIVGH
jgi:hypothetical protein